MTTYEMNIDTANTALDFYQTEKFIYGSSRLGMLKDSVNVLGSAYGNTDTSNFVHTIGNKRYELSNHLGNVLTVISDKPIPHNNGGTVDYFMADIKSAQDYSPFGVTLSGRDFNSFESRYSFQGQEHDDEIKGKGNSVNYTYRMHDTRLGRFFAVDPLTNTYPYLSPYHFSHNSPIYMIEIEGLEGTIYVYKCWTDNSGYHVSSKPIDSYVVEGLKSNVYKTLIMPYGEPNGKAVQIKYSSAAPNGSSLTMDANNKPSVKELNEFFGNKMPIKEKTSKSFAQKFNDLAPSWLKDGAMEGGANGADGQIKQTSRDKSVAAGAISLILLPVTATFATVGATVVTVAAGVNAIDDLTTDGSGQTALMKVSPQNANLVGNIKIATSIVTGSTSAKVAFDLTKNGKKGEAVFNAASAVNDFISVKNSIKSKKND